MASKDGAECQQGGHALWGQGGLQDSQCSRDPGLETGGAPPWLPGGPLSHPGSPVLRLQVVS